MWNQPQSKTPYYSYSAKRKQQLTKYARYKLFVLIVARGTYRVMRDTLQHVQKVTSGEVMLMEKVWNHANRHSFTAQKAALQKLKENVIVCRSHQATIKNMVTLLERMTKYKTKKTFSTIALYAQRKNQLLVSNIDYIRKIIFCRKIEKLFLNKKRQHLAKMLDQSVWIKNKYKKVKIIGMIGGKYVKTVKQACFNRLTKNFYTTNTTNKLSSTQYSFKQINQKKNLQKRLTEMQNDLETKNASICKLEQQILQLKMQQSSPNFNSFSEYTNYNSGQPNRNRSINKGNRRQNESLDSGFEFSLGSILGNSFTLNKSRSKQMRKGDSVASFECNCSYREKYVKMKNSNESLKNQLEIVKEQLQVAKDLNDHFTNEIRQYYGGEKDSSELDRLRKQLKQMQKEKEEMRMKIAKYQNHITTLKSEFKLKIEELYRKVKKER